MNVNLLIGIGVTLLVGAFTSGTLIRRFGRPRDRRRRGETP